MRNGTKNGGAVNLGNMSAGAVAAYFWRAIGVDAPQEIIDAQGAEFASGYAMSDGIDLPSWCHPLCTGNISTGGWIPEDY